MPGIVEGKVAIVTRAGRGIGRGAKDFEATIGSARPSFTPPPTALCDQPRRQSIVHRRRVFHHRDLDDGLEIKVAFPTAPNMNLPLIPFFNPFGGN